MSAITYRPDIDGLRAVAVLAVVLYHFGIGPIHGGFVGVDVFFVISGYLITKIIHRQIGEGRFTFAGFYERRIRRILPALFVMLVATLVAGVWILLPTDIAGLTKSTLATLLFASNIFFWRNSGYFDPASDLNPQLHTWSLAVEEQFYIFFPVFLIVAARWGERPLKAVLAIGAVGSFAACVYFQSWQPTGVFYLSLFRAWELALGSLLALGAFPQLTSARLREVISLAALAILLGSLWWTRAGLEFPGWRAAFPVVATAALIWTGESGDTWVRRLLSLRPMVLVGLISYSLYLWHWPLIVYADYLTGMTLTTFDKLALLGVALAISAASYRWVETPFRQARSNEATNRKQLFVTTAAATGALAVAAVAVGSLAISHTRYPNRVLALDAARQPTIPFQACDGVTPLTNDPACRIGSPDATPTTLVWGDSHAIAWAPAFRSVELQNAFGPVELAVKSACGPLSGVTLNYGTGCAQFNDQVIGWIARNRPSRVIMIASWTEYSRPDGFYTLTDETGESRNPAVFSAALRRTIAEVAPSVKEIVLIGPTPGAPANAALRAALAELGRGSWAPPVHATGLDEKARFFWSTARSLDQNQVVLVDPEPWFCDDDDCGYVSQGELLYRDDSHLSVAGADYVARRLLKSLSQAAEGANAPAS